MADNTIYNLENAFMYALLQSKYYETDNSLMYSLTP